MIIHFKRYVEPSETETYSVKGTMVPFQSVEYYERDNHTHVKVIHRKGKVYIKRTAKDLKTKVYLSKTGSKISVMSDVGEMEIEAMLHNVTIGEKMWRVEYSLPTQGDDKVVVTWTMNLVN